MGAPVLSFPEKGSRVLREWHEQRQLARLIEQRNRTHMRSAAGKNGFAGAAIDRLTASLQQWSGALNADLDNALAILRSRARGLCANGEFGRRFLSMVAMNVIGPKGPALQVRAMSSPGVLDKAANDAIEVHYKRWSKSADIAGRMNLAHLLRVALKAAARDGEALIRRINGPRLPYGMALQLLEADRLDEALNQRLDNGNMIRMGVEIDSTQRPLAYWLKTWHPGENFTIGGQRYERIPADELYHVYLPERAEQVRGYTWLHAVLLRAARISGYEEAALVAALVGASKNGIFTRTTDEPGPSLGNQLADAKDATTGALQMNAEPGEFIDLTGMPGTKLESWNPDYPHQNFESFLKQCMRGFAAGLDVATHNLSGDMTDVNYSSARIAELSERDMWMMLQEWFFCSFLEQIFRDWLASALLRGAITFEDSGKALPASKLAKFADAARFQGRTWAWVDPLKEVSAKIEAIDAKITSRTRVAAEDGEEYEDVVDEIAQETDYAKSKNVDLTMAPKAGAPMQDSAGDRPAGEDAAGKKKSREWDPELKETLAIIRKFAERKPEPVVHNHTVNVPERTVAVENHVAPAAVSVAAPGVTVNAPVSVKAYPSESVETIERDAGHEISRVTRENKD